MRRFALAFVVAVTAIAVLAPIASAIPEAKLSCRKTGGDTGTTYMKYELKDVLISS